MIRPDQIPDAVVEALLAHLNTCECRECTAETIAAALNAWPEVKVCAEDDLGPACIILPLPAENSDD